MKTAVEQIKERLPINEVLASYITLIPAGTQFKAKCPFHQERTASFSISPERGQYYCFGCGAKGDIFTFVEQFEGLDFKGALRVLADRAHVSLTQQRFEADPNDALYAVLERATGVYENLLQKNAAARAYLASRGITEKTIRAFRIGFAPDEWHGLGERLDVREHDAAFDAGLFQRSDRGYYDRFRGRIMFPLFDSSGRVIAFSGRLFVEMGIGDGAKNEAVQKIEAPKYLNSPETPVFHKSRVLYGFNFAKQGIKKNNFSVLVEGQFDLVASHQAGFVTTIATSGTAVSEEAVKDPFSNFSVVSRLSQNIILAFDGDAAGQSAMTKAARVVLMLGMNVKVATIPDGNDPADILTQPGGANTWKKILQDALPFVEHQTKRILVNAKSTHAIMQGVRTTIFPYLAGLPSTAERTRSVTEVAELVGVSTSALAQDFEQFFATYLQEHPQNIQNNTENKRKEGTDNKNNLSEVGVPLTTYERYIGILERISGEQKQLAALRFHDTIFIVPTLDAARTQFIQVAIEREYRDVPADELSALADDLLKSITRDFFLECKREHTKALHDAEHAHDDVAIERELGYLRELYQLVSRD